MNPHAATWDEIRRLLLESRGLMDSDNGTRAATAVPVGVLAGTLDEFEEFLDHNELELAWDALAEVAEKRKAPPACWRNLSRAAALMQLADKEHWAAQHAEPAVSSDQALAIASADAKGAYRDLSPYRIHVALEEDGWHIDYELRDARLTGGGPHYVIDSATGTIVSKRYDQ